MSAGRTPRWIPGLPQTEEGAWSLMRDTGKLKGVKAKGTYKGKAGATER
ncbi:MAG: hypothetical protein HY237_00515 [Acidobacteria bacterium]|nr:hypothetical protein [Acidobacteriota bacterium]